MNTRERSTDNRYNMSGSINIERRERSQTENSIHGLVSCIGRSSTTGNGSVLGQGLGKHGIDCKGAQEN